GRTAPRGTGGRPSCVVAFRRNTERPPHVARNREAHPDRARPPFPPLDPRTGLVDGKPPRRYFSYREVGRNGDNSARPAAAGDEGTVACAPVGGHALPPRDASLPRVPPAAAAGDGAPG